MKRYRTMAILFSLMLLVACFHKSPPASNNDANPAAEGFDYDHSDPAAIELADSVMSAMGGRTRWDRLHFISFSVQGRQYTWNKLRGQLRVDYSADSLMSLIDLEKGHGRILHRGQEVPNGSELQAMLKKIQKQWQDDFYSLFMPFLLKNSGMTIKYLGEELIDDSKKRANVIQLTTKKTATSPVSKYLLYVDLEDNLVKQCSYFFDIDQDTATYTQRWDNYTRHGSVLLSSDRSDGSGPVDVKVWQSLPEEVFASF